MIKYHKRKDSSAQNNLIVDGVSPLMLLYTPASKVKLGGKFWRKGKRKRVKPKEKKR